MRPFQRTAVAILFTLVGPSLLSADELPTSEALVELAASPLASDGADLFPATNVQPASNVVETLEISRLGDCDGTDNCGCCTCEEIKAASAKAASAYKGVFYDNDFSYINVPCYQEHLLGDRFKQLNMPHCGKLDIGGQIRLRYHHELGMKGDMNSTERFLPGTDDDFLLTRLRLFGNYKVNHWLRFYIEGLYADSSFEKLPPRGIDQNFMDFQNVFVDVKLTDSLLFRPGRQELLYGAQRTVSPLDWANVRRKFEGFKAIYKSGDWHVDGFFTHLVPVLPNDLDEADYDQPFYGMYGVYSGLEYSTVDFYYLGYDNNNTGRSLHTLGSRLNGKNPCTNWLWEVEAAVQFGKFSTGVDQEGEGFVTVGLGRAFPRMMWKPTLWVYFDYASPKYFQLFPLAHKYLGFIDAVQRQNIESPNVLLTMTPHKDWKILLWGYHFESASAAPVPAIPGSTTPSQNAGRNYGNELDCILSYRFRPRADILFGYSHFWRGSKINNTQDADFFYTQLQVNF